MGDEAGGLLVFVLVALAAIWMVWHYHRGRELVVHWAHRHGYTLEECGYRHVARGPFLWASSKSQAVYRVKVRTHDGQIRWGWVRCGGWISGLFSDQIEVRWDAAPDEPPS